MSHVPLATIPVDEAAKPAIATGAAFTKPVEDKYVGGRISPKQVRLFLSTAKTKAERLAIVTLSGIRAKRRKKL